MPDIEMLTEALRSPVTQEDVIGFYKILSFKDHHVRHLDNLINISLKYGFTPQQVYLNMLDLPEICQALNLHIIKEYSYPIPLRLSFGAVVFGFVWDNYITDTVRRTGRWEPDVQDLISGILKPGDVALDIGGNIGCHTALMASIVGPVGAVHTFEPVRQNIEALRRMKQVNGYDQVELHPVAVSAKEGFLTISVHATNSGGNSIGAHANSSSVEYIRSVDLDSYLLPKLTRLDFAKIDIEGHEGPALAGARQTLARFRPTVLMELGPQNLRLRETDPVELVQTLLDADLAVKVVGADEEFSNAGAVVEYVETRAPFMDIVAKRRPT